jgi:outer membrane protein assembly factor BamA
MRTPKKRAALLATALAVALALPGRAAGEEKANEKDVYKARLIGVPFIYYSPETKLAFGGGGVFNFRAGRRKEESRTSSVWGYASYNMARQFSVLVKPEIFIKRNNVYLHGNIRYERAPQLFYGIGNDMPAGDEESFTPRTLTVQLGAKRRVVAGLFAGLQYDFETVAIEKVETGGLLESGTIPGGAGGTFSGVGFSLDWDTRDAVLFPRRGMFAAFNADAYASMAGTTAAYTSLKLDVRKYVGVGADRVMAFQVYFHSIAGDVPFQRLALLGGESLMRGYYKGRFRDKGLLALQAEYRQLVSARIGIAAFAGLAEVFRGLRDLRVERLKYSLGGGLRYVVNKRDGTAVRLDFAWGQACFGAYLTAKEAF